jgi:hypothetical protein
MNSLDMQVVNINCHITTIKYKNLKMIDLFHIISILNFVFIIVFYGMGWTKQDLIYICFEEFLNQLNLLYIWICVYFQYIKIYGHVSKWDALWVVITLLAKRIYLNLFYYFMILFQCNNVVILSLIIFLLNYNQHVNSLGYKTFWNPIALRGVIN